MPRVRVGIRIKPETQESIQETFTLKRTEDSKKTVDITVEGQRHEFSFDDVFTADSTQDDVFKTCAIPITEDVIDGYNGCIFAYGQTGSC